MRSSDEPVTPAPPADAELEARSDGELLAAFRDHGSHEAFGALARRHGGMVSGVCRRVLGSAAEADDAAQAALLVLARRAGAIPADRVAAWLHGVAVRCAQRFARERRRRQRWEGAAARSVATPTGSADAALESARGELDAALARLPAPYREAVMLCHLEGRTQAEAAAIVGCPVGTLGRRASDGLRRLRDLLARRGVAGALVTPLLMGEATAGATAKPIAWASALVSPTPAVAAAATAVAASSFAAVAIGAAAAVCALAAVAAPLALHSRLALPPPVVQPMTAATPVWTDAFRGGLIDARRWIVHDPPSGTRVRQSDGLVIDGSGESGVFGVTGIESAAVVPRAGTTITMTVAAQARTHALVLGYGEWPRPQGASESYEVLFANSGLMHFARAKPGNSALANPWLELVDLGPYVAGRTYRLKLVLRTVGADLYVDAGSGFPVRPSASLSGGSFDGCVFSCSEQQRIDVGEIAVSR
jgi:RNA polymerase sigma factor (sigma-70 family)